MPLSLATNLGILRSALGHTVFSSFVGTSDAPSCIHFCCPIIGNDKAHAYNSSDNDDSNNDTLSPDDSLKREDAEDGVNTDTPRQSASAPSSTKQAELPDRPDVIPFDPNHSDLPMDLASQDDTIFALNNQTKLLRYHYRFSHLPFAIRRLMAAPGELPKRPAACRVPKCQPCLYGRATKRLWRTKGATKKLRTTTKHGQCISVDQLELPVAGFVGRKKGFFFRKRYKVTTIFVDHFSRLSFVCLQESTKGDKTLLAKRAFEAYAVSFHFMTAQGETRSKRDSMLLRQQRQVALLLRWWISNPSRLILLIQAVQRTLGMIWRLRLLLLSLLTERRSPWNLPTQKGTGNSPFHSPNRPNAPPD